MKNYPIHCIRKNITAIAWLLVVIQFLIWTYITYNLMFVGQPLVVWDTARYLGDAANLYISNNFFEQLRAATFPVFSWPIVGFFRLFDIPMSYGALSFTNFLLWNGILIGSTYWLCRLTKINSIIGAIVLSLHFSSATAFSSTSGLMGDLAVFSWYMLVTCLLCSASRESKWALLFAFLAGIIIGNGSQVKTICIMAGLCLIGGYVLSLLYGLFLGDKSKILVRLGGIFLRLLLLILGLAVALILIAHRDAFDIISKYYYNNETLAIWKSYNGLYNGVLWFPTVIFETFPFASILFLITIFIILITNFNFNKNYISLFGSRREFSDLLLIGAPILVEVSYISFFVISKFIRPMYFLIPVFIFFTIFFVRIIINRIGFLKSRSIVGVLPYFVLLVFVINTICTASWVLFREGSWANYMFILPNRGFRLDVPLIKEPTWEDTGLREIRSYLNDIALKNKEEKLYVLVPSYMSTLCESLLYSSYLSLSTIQGDNLPKPPPITYIDFTFKYGAWGNFGGFPRAYFTNSYIIYSNQGWVEKLPDDLLLYPNLLCKRLSEYTPAYWDGMIPIIFGKNSFGFDVVLAQRIAMAKPETFLEIMKEVAALDPNNLWNLPLLAAAYQIEPSLLFKDQIDFMLADTFNPVYIIDSRLTARQIAHLRKHWPTVPSALHYPAVLSQHPDLPSE